MIQEQEIRQVIRKIVEAAMGNDPVLTSSPGHCAIGKGEPIDSPRERASAQTGGLVPAEVSARHIHLSQRDVDALFGVGYSLKKKKDISQPGQFICEERVTLIGPKGQLTNVAVLGPVRSHTQAEISLTDSRSLGITVPVRMSGDLEGASDIYLMQGEKIIKAESAAIAAKNHIHMTPADAERFCVSHGQTAHITMNTQRPLTFCGVAVRIDPAARLAFHMDTDEANACGYKEGDTGAISVAGQGYSNMDAWACKAQTYMQPVKEIQASQQQEQQSRRVQPRVEEFAGKLMTEQAALELRQDGCLLEMDKATVVTPMARDVLRRRRITLQWKQR